MTTKTLSSCILLMYLLPKTDLQNLINTKYPVSMMSSKHFLNDADTIGQHLMKQSHENFNFAKYLIRLYTIIIFKSKGMKQTHLSVLGSLVEVHN